MPAIPTAWFGIVPTATGGEFELSPSPTVTLTVCAALAPSGSAAVIVTTAFPSATPLMDTVAPSTDVVAAAVLDDSASYVRSSPSGSLK
ncbi:MAG: hypothetical protein OXH46_02715 [Gemmatimonadetes bacterium]|nr:hypothetical protein [Gemmatimonadota bacterium]